MITNIYRPKPPIENKCKHDFVPCEELFPEWMTARVMLEPWVNKIGDIDINIDSIFRCINIMFVLPMSRDLSGELIYDHLTFPPEDQQHLKRIVESVVIDYRHPNLESLLGEPMLDSTFLNRSISMHNDVVNTIVSMGGRTPINELKFRLGIASFSINMVQYHHQ